MVVCRYFMNGGCMHGSRCRYEHIQNGHDFRYSDNYNYASNKYSGGRSVLRSNYVKVNNNTQAAPVREDASRHVGKENVNEIYQSMIKEISAAEKGHQWPLSCFGLIRGCPELNIPGWIDHSPEEIRWELYKAYQNGTFAVCKQAIDALFNDAKDKRAKIKIKENAYSIIQNLLEKENMNAIDMEPGLTATSDINWNRQNESATGFGNNVAAPFASSNTAAFFQTTVPNNSFPVTAQPVSTFGIPQQTSSFGNTSSSSFGAVNPSVNHSFRFQLDPNPQTQSSVFPQNPFNTQDKFINNTTASTPANNARVDLQDRTIFSIQSELSESDIKAFESNVFTFGSIPLKPPTKELCRL